MTTTKKKTVTKRAVPAPTAKAKAKKAIPAKAKAPSKVKKAVAPKKKLGGAKPKAAPTKVGRGRTDDWFKALTKKAKLAYIKAHPNSKYAKSGVSGIDKETISRAITGRGGVMPPIKRPKEKPLTAAQTKAQAKANAKLKAAAYDYGEKPVSSKFANEVKRTHTVAKKAVASLTKKIKAHSDKVKAIVAKGKTAKTPKAKINAKAKAEAARNKLRALKEMHGIAKKEAAEKKKAAAHVTKRVTKKKVRTGNSTALMARKLPASALKARKEKAAKAKASAGKPRKPVMKKTVKLKSGKISLRNGGKASGKSAKASAIREMKRKEKLKSKR